MNHKGEIVCPISREEAPLMLINSNVKLYTFEITEFIYVNLQHLCTRTCVGWALSFPYSLSQGMLRATSQGDGPQIRYFCYLRLIGHSLTA